MRLAILLLLLLWLVPVLASGPFTIAVRAPGQSGEALLLYRYDDLFTLRTTRIAETALDDAGQAVLRGEVEGTTRMQLRIGDGVADLYLRPGMDLHVEWPGPDPRSPRSLDRPARVPIVFHDMDPLDINALTSDLNERLDDFLLEDLATDAVGGMQAVEVKRRDANAPDTVQRPPTLFVTPRLSPARVDTFEKRLGRFYRGIDDPWFFRYLEYGVAGLRHGPNANDKELFERYLKGREVAYDNPEYVRFLRGFFEEFLHAFAFRHHGKAMAQALALGDLDSLEQVLARNDFLRDEERLRELVALDQLYQFQGHALVPREGALTMLTQASTHARHPEHRAIAANMLWDLTTMQTGSALPPMLLEDLQGREVTMDTLAQGPFCLFFTTMGCTYCELELAGLEQLHQEYGDLIPIVVISLDQDLQLVKQHVKEHPKRTFRWLHARADRQLREDLRLRTLPTVLLIQDGVLLRTPAPLPSTGLGEVFHRTRVQAERDGRIKVWDD